MTGASECHGRNHGGDTRPKAHKRPNRGSGRLFREVDVIWVAKMKPDNTSSELEKAWRKLLEEHPELANLPEHAESPKLQEVYQVPESWLADIRLAEELRGSLPEPDRTIFDLYLKGQTHQQIGHKINRSRQCVTKHLGKIAKLAYSLHLSKLSKNTNR